jgi:hypothetical protein
VIDEEGSLNNKSLQALALIRTLRMAVWMFDRQGSKPSERGSHVIERNVNERQDLNSGEKAMRGVDQWSQVQFTLV